MDKTQLMSHWIEASDRDYTAMLHLFEKKDYHWSLFIGHQVIEKLIKAFYIKHINLQPPFIHNLLLLAEKSKLELNETQKDILDTVSTFNIRARYDDYKSEFYKTCSKDFTKIWIDKIKVFRTWIKIKL